MSARTERVAGTASGAAQAYAELSPWLERAAHAAESGGDFHTAAGQELYLKYSPLRGKTRRRHGLRWLLGHEPPRLREFENLSWLRAHDFHAPEPLFAGVFGARHAPVFQFLATRRVPAARTLRELLEEGPTEARAPALERLGRETARLHELGFVHRDLFPRNLLVTGPADEPRIGFLDAWRGGPGHRVGPASRLERRGPAYDLACLMLYGAGLFSPAEQERFFTAYFAGRGLTQDHSVRMLSSAAGLRRALVRTMARRGRNDPEVPCVEWDPHRAPT